MRWKKLCVIYSLLRCGGPPTADAQPMYPLLFAPEITTHTWTRAQVPGVVQLCRLLSLLSWCSSAFVFELAFCFCFQVLVALKFAFLFFWSLSLIFFSSRICKTVKTVCSSEVMDTLETILLFLDSFPIVPKRNFEPKSLQLPLLLCFLLLSSFHRLTQSHYLYYS